MPYPRRLALCIVAIMLGGTSAAWATSAAEPAAAGKLDRPVSTGLMRTLRQASRAGLARKSAAAGSLQAISGPAVGAGKKPGVLYIGADYCPYCAAARWPLVVALLRFGHFGGLRYMRSSSADVYPNTVTFSFHGAHYHSDYLNFQGVEIENRARQRLEQPSAKQMAILRQFDAEPYTQTPGAIPFLYIGGRYVHSGSPYNPGLLKGRSWRQVAKQLTQHQTRLAQQILGTANTYTAALCQLTHGAPAKVCNTAAVKAGQAHLKGH
jgi:hypothetical protein